jgi:ribosomal protein S18 acetylase RimI-like enzyme
VSRAAAAVTLRDAVDGDRAFLRSVFASTRPRELAALTGDTREWFIDDQFGRQEAHYRAYPDATFSIVEVDGEPAGRLYVSRGLEAGEVRIIDIALIERFRGQGIGTYVLDGLLREADAAGARASIHVEVDNPARRLYERLGFVAAAEQRFSHYVLLERRPGASS